MRCKFHSTRPLLPFLSIFRSLFHSCRSPFSLWPYRPTDLPLPSQPFPPISFLLFPTSSFLYLRPPAPLFEIVSQESSLFLSPSSFPTSLLLPLSFSLFPMSPSIRWSYHDRLARTDTLFRGSSRFLRSKRERESSWQSVREDLSRMRRPS